MIGKNDTKGMSQDQIRLWNDAVNACRSAALAVVDHIESAAGDGMPSPARSVVRAVGEQALPGDDRTFFEIPASVLKLFPAFEEMHPRLAPEVAEPDWSAGGKVHNWRSYVADEVREIWGTFTPAQKAALHGQAQNAADREDWV